MGVLMIKSISLALIFTTLISFHSRAMESDKVVKTAKTIAIKSIVCSNPPNEYEAIKVLATKSYERDRPKALRKLDLKNYPCFTSKTPVINKEYGHQFRDYGPFEQLMLTEVQYFVHGSKPMLWVELAAGYGAFPLRVYEHTREPAKAHFIVNDINKDNLKDLQEVVVQNKELSPIFTIVAKNCLSLQVKEADFISALNLTHFQSPSQVVCLFANASDSLKDGGKYFILHDLMGSYEICPSVDAKLKKYTKNYENSIGVEDYNNEALNAIERDMRMYTRIKFRSIHEFLQKKKFEFPLFWSKNLLNFVFPDPVDMFLSPPEFLIEVAHLVGLKLEKKIPLRRELGDESVIKEINIEKATAIGYVFVKEQNVCQYRETSAFKELIQRTELADKQREKINLRHSNYYPFIEESK